MSRHLNSVHVRVPDLDRVETWALTEPQADGHGCISCSGESGPMVPVAYTVGARTQVFAHRGCWDRVMKTRGAHGGEFEHDDG